MGREVNSIEPADYAAQVKRNVEAAIHEAGFPGYYQPGTITMSCLARISAVLGEDPHAWFPPDQLASTEGAAQPVRGRSASTRTGRRPGTHKFALAPRAQFLIGR